MIKPELDNCFHLFFLFPRKGTSFPGSVMEGEALSMWISPLAGRDCSFYCFSSVSNFGSISNFPDTQPGALALWSYQHLNWEGGGGFIFSLLVTFRQSLNSTSASSWKLSIVWDCEISAFTPPHCCLLCHICVVCVCVFRVGVRGKIVKKIYFCVVVFPDSSLCCYKSICFISGPSKDCLWQVHA